MFAVTRLGPEAVSTADAVAALERAAFREYMAAVRELVGLYPPGPARDRFVRSVMAEIRSALDGLS